LSDVSAGNVWATAACGTTVIKSRMALHFIVTFPPDPIIYRSL
jgi:hypothetical protein